jgi:anti-sigma factor RsiW
MKESCSSLSKLLEKYFDNEVTDKERSLVEKHLLNCPICQGALTSMKEVRDIIKDPDEEAIPNQDMSWVWQRIQREIRLKERPTLWGHLRPWLERPFPFRKRVWMPAAAATIILALVAAQLLFKKTPSFPDPTVVIYAESQTHNVMVYESGKGMVTVIWLFEGLEKELPTS